MPPQALRAPAVPLGHGLNDYEKNHWNGLVRRTRRKRTTGFNLFLSAGMKEFEKIQRIQTIKSVIMSSRRWFVSVKARSICTTEQHAMLINAFIISSAFRYRRE
mgnify:CR=1 FL=1